MISTTVHHISFVVHDLEPALRFYRDVLGFEPIDRPAMGIDGAWLSTGAAQIHLIVPPDGADVGAAPSKTSPIAGHTAFEIDDYDRVRDHLAKHGLEVLELGRERGQMWVSDPSGNVLEFTTNPR